MSTFQDAMLPIFFYIYSVFSLHSLLVASLYIITWLLSGSWLGGALTALFYIFNRYSMLVYILHASSPTGLPPTTLSISPSRPSYFTLCWWRHSTLWLGYSVDHGWEGLWQRCSIYLIGSIVLKLKTFCKLYVWCVLKMPDKESLAGWIKMPSPSRMIICYWQCQLNKTSLAISS